MSFGDLFREDRPNKMPQITPKEVAALMQAELGGDADESVRTIVGTDLPAIEELSKRVSVKPPAACRRRMPGSSVLLAKPVSSARR
jgi:hypothetical protein